MLYTYFFLPVLAVVPSVLWLLFYYRKDKKPEPKSLILKIFSWGIVISFPVYLFEILFRFFLQPELSPGQLISSPLPAEVYFALIIFAGPLIEEFFKLGIVRFHLLKSSEFDEPTDVIIYAVVVGLGFAAIENFVFLLRTASFNGALLVITFRFFSTTLLHANATAIGGYFLAKSLKKNSLALALFGLLLATLFHSCYNYFIWQLKTNGFFIALVAGLLALLALVVSWQIKKLQRKPSICQIKN